MTLGQFAYALGAPPKWVQNAWSILGLPPHYDEADLWRMTLVRLLELNLAVPLKQAYAMSGVLALQQTGHYQAVDIRLVDDDGLDVSLHWPRFVTGVLLGLSRARTQYQERRRGRPPKRELRGCAAAEAQGLDIGLLRRSLWRSPADRLRALDEDLAFVQRLRVES